MEQIHHYQIHDQSSHLKNEGRIIGRNAGYLDGHVEWGQFTAVDSGRVKRRVIMGPTFFW